MEDAKKARKVNNDQETVTVIKFAVLTFFACFLYSILSQHGISEIRAQYDDVGKLIYPAYLVGYDWSDVITYCQYYGGGYYVLFTPLLKICSNFVSIWRIAIICHYVIKSLGVTISYITVVKYCGFKNELITVLECCVAGIFFGQFTTMSNEPMLYFLTWVFVLLLCILNSTDKKGTLITISILLGLFTGYSFLVHTRAIVFAVTVACILVLILINKRKKDYFLVMIFYFLIVGLMYFGSEYIKDIVQKEVYLAKDANMVNSSLIVGKASFKSLFSLEGIRACWDLLMGNLWATASSTYGISIIGIVLIPFVAKKVLKNESGNSEIVYLFSFICIFLGVMGLIATYGRYLIKYYPDLSDAYESKGFFYTRYYITFIGPYLLYSVHYCVEFIRNNNWAKTFAICLTFGQFVYFMLAILPLLGDSANTNKSSMLFIESNQVPDLNNFKLAFVLQLIFVVSVIVSKFDWKILLLILIISMRPWYFRFSDGILRFSDNKSADAGYKLITELKENDIVTKGYYSLNPTAGRVYQLYLLKEKVHIGIPEHKDNNLVFSIDTRDYDNMTEIGYVPYRLDNNEFVWVEKDSETEDYMNNTGMYVLYEQGE